MTLLTIAQNVLKRNKASEIPTTIAGNNNDTAKLVFSAIRDGTLIVKEATRWQILTKIYSFNTVADQANYALPSDMEEGNIIADTFWNATTRFQLTGPLSLSQWQLLNNFPVVSTIIQNFIILENQLSIYPTPSQADSLNYCYMSNNIIKAADTSPQTDWLADDDYSVLNEYAIELQASWNYLKQLGRPYDEEKLKADNYLADLVKKDGSRAVIGVNMTQIRPVQANLSWLGIINR